MPQTRNYTVIQVTLPPAELEILDKLAEQIAEPGARWNRSQAVRYALRMTWEGRTRGRKRNPKNPD